MPKKYPFESSGFRQDGHMLWRRLTGKGMVVRHGTLSKLRRFKRPENTIKIPFTGKKYNAGVPVHYYEIEFAEAPDVIQGYVNVEKTINRIKNKEGVAIKVDPETLWVRRIWPLDRKLKWYQF